MEVYVFCLHSARAGRFLIHLGESILFNETFQTSKRTTKLIWSDKGKEFYNTHVKDLLKSKNMKLYSTDNEEKGSVVERWNRTIKNKMWKMFSANNNTIYYNKLDKILHEYNYNNYHSSLKITPAEASQNKNE